MSSTTSNNNDDYTLEQKDLIDKALDTWQCRDLEASIEVFVRWWGFTVELNQKAVNMLDQCLTYLEEMLGKHFAETKLRRAISFCIQFKQARLTNAVESSDDGYVRLISPWVIPFALTVVRGSSGDDRNLWFTVWDPDKKQWGEQAEFHECLSRNAPALAQHGDLLYCVHRGDTSDLLKWSVYSTNDGWSDDHDFPNHWTETNPSLVEFNNTLYCFHRGAGLKDQALYYCTFNTASKTWNDDIVIKVGDQVQYSESGCAVAVFNEELHMVYQSGNSNDIYHRIFNKDTNAWRTSINPAASTKDTPALVAYGTDLLLVHRGDGDEFIWYCTYNGNSWTKEQQIPGMYSSMGPGLAVFGNEVFMVHRSNKSNGELYYSIYNGSSWSPDAHIDGQSTGAPPALACYTDPQCIPANYTDSKTAEPRLICVHRGWGT